MKQQHDVGLGLDVVGEGEAAGYRDKRGGWVRKECAGWRCFFWADSMCETVSMLVVFARFGSQPLKEPPQGPVADRFSSSPPGLRNAYHSNLVVDLNLSCFQILRQAERETQTEAVRCARWHHAQDSSESHLLCVFCLCSTERTSDFFCVVCV